MTASEARQLPLPLEIVPRLADWPFIEAPSNRAALVLLDRAETWPDRRLVLWGEPGSGKTHLVHRWARRHGTTPLEGATLRFPSHPPPGALAVDDADLAPEEMLLHVLNDSAEAQRPTLLTMRSAPALCPTRLPDLASRLRATLAAGLGRPDDALLRVLFAMLFAERQMQVAEPVQDWMRLRLPRDAAALREAAARLDRLALGAGRRVSRSLAAAVVDEIERMWQPMAS